MEENQLPLFEFSKVVENKTQWEVFFDGSCSPNPGRMGIGVYIISSNGKDRYEISKPLGQGTSNIAEYTAVLTALRTIKELKMKNVLIKGDSTNAVRAMQGLQKSNIHPNLIELVREGMALLEELKPQNIKFEWISRENNSIADELSTRR